MEVAFRLTYVYCSWWDLKFQVETCVHALTVYTWNFTPTT